MRVLILILVAWLFIHSCHHLLCCNTYVVHGSSAGLGRDISERSREFVAGLRDGAGDADFCTLTMADRLRAAGLQRGKFKIVADTTGDNDNTVSVYVIFNKDFSGPVTAKLYDGNMHEYGRQTVTLSGKAGEARYCNIVFEKVQT